MERIVIIAAWIGIFAGLLGGAAQGLRFADPDWLGGYWSWRRRMLRLAHVSLIALPLMNLASLYSIAYLKAAGRLVGTTLVLLLVAQASMPTVCVASAIDRRMRHLFFVPVASLVSSVAAMAYMATL